MGCRTVKNCIMHIHRTLSKIHSLYSTSNHGGCSVTCRVIHMCTAILIVHIKLCIIFSSFRHLFIFLSSFFPLFPLSSSLHLVIFLEYLDSHVEICHVFIASLFFHLHIYLIIFIIILAFVVF